MVQKEMRRSHKIVPGDRVTVETDEFVVCWQCGLRLFAWRIFATISLKTVELNPGLNIFRWK